MTDTKATPATDCTCEDVRELMACPVHEPRNTTPAGDAFVAAWLADLEPYEDHERENDVKARDIRSLLYRIAADAETIRNHESQARDARVYIANLEAERVALRDQVKAKDEEIERLKNGEPCAVCGGSGSPTSGLPCACEGSGKLWKAEQRTRRECMELRDQVRVLREALKAVSAMAVNWEPLTPGDIAEVAAALAATEPKG